MAVAVIGWLIASTVLSLVFVPVVFTAPTMWAPGSHEIRHHLQGRRLVILDRDPLELEFFRPELNPTESWFSACIRVNDLDALCDAFLAANLRQLSLNAARDA